MYQKTLLHTAAHSICRKNFGNFI